MLRSWRSISADSSGSPVVLTVAVGNVVTSPSPNSLWSRLKRGSVSVNFNLCVTLKLLRELGSIFMSVEKVNVGHQTTSSWTEV